MRRIHFTSWLLAGLMLSFAAMSSPAGVPADYTSRGTQPGLVHALQGSANCAGCHSNGPLEFHYPHSSWEGSMMANAGRDPLFWAALDVANADGRERLRNSGVTVPDLVERARGGDDAALNALQESGHYLGIGLGAIVNALNPARIVIGGEITAGWDLIEARVRAAARSRALTQGAAETPILTEDTRVHPRLRGATALVVAPMFAAPEIA